MPRSTSAPARPTSRRQPLRLLVGLGALGLAPLGLVLASTAAADPVINLGTAEDFSVLAGSGITNTGVTRLAGSLGTYETPTVTTDTPFDFTGAGAKNHAGDGITQQAKTDLSKAYDAAAAAQPPTAVPQELSRIDPYLPGVYRASSSLLLSGAMTLDGGGRNDGVFVFQAPTSTLTTESNARVIFVNGAQPCNVYWQVGSSATFGTDTTFVGNVLARTSITAKTGADFAGRLLANDGAVTLDSNTITAPGCEVEPVAGGTDTDGTDTDGAATGTEAGTDTGTDVDAGTDTGTDAGTDAGGTDTDAPSADAGGALTDSATETGVDSTGSGTGTDTDTGGAGTGTEAADTDLPDTGGPTVLPMVLAIVAVIGGVALIRARRTQGGSHRG